MHRRTFLASVAALGATALTARAATKPDDVRMIAVPGGKVWTKTIGHGPVKVLLLHGGPGFSHDYLEPFEKFLSPTEFTVTFYDQLGCGRSDHPKDDKLWTLPRYVEEVEAVRKALGFDHFVLYGHSFGAMLGIEYALKYQQHLSNLVLSNMTASIGGYIQYADELRGKLSQADQATLTKYEKLGKTNDPAYVAVMDKVYAQHVLRLPQPWPLPVMRTLTGANQHIYNLMQGPNEFSITGTLKTWDRWADLPKIKVPTLVMGAKYDEMSPEQIRREGKLIPGAKTWISDKGSHLVMWDDHKAYFAALVPFLLGKA